MKARLLGTGRALPGDEIAGAILDNVQLAELMGEVRERLREEAPDLKVLPTDPEFPERRLGVLRRRVLERSLSVRDMAVTASRLALEDAGVETDDDVAQGSHRADGDEHAGAVDRRVAHDVFDAQRLGARREGDGLLGVHAVDALGADRRPRPTGVLHASRRLERRARRRVHLVAVVHFDDLDIVGLVEDPGDLLDQLAETLQGVLVVASGAEPADRTEEERAALATLADGADPDQVLAMLDVLVEANWRLRQRHDAHLVVEMTILTLARLPRLEPVSEAVAALRAAGAIVARSNAEAVRLASDFMENRHVQPA